MTIIEFLNKCGMQNIQPVTVKINGKTYQAAKYTNKTGHGEDIYCVGFLPPVYLRSSHVCFTIPGDKRDWYIASYFPISKNRCQPLPQDIDPEYHPFGPNFMLTPWTVKDSQIDSYEKAPYKRIEISVTT